MRRFRLHGGSGLGAMSRQEANNHMLCKQDPRRSSNKLHDYGERASSGGLRSREVPALPLGEQDHHLQ